MTHRKKPIIAPSVLASDLLNLEKEIKRIEKTEAEWLHLDIMDGHFVPNITFGYGLVRKIRDITDLFLDVHLMIEYPDKYIENFADAGADMITYHIETSVHHHRVFQKIKDMNVLSGISVNPGTSLSSISEIVKYVDMVLLMSVNPGFGGQKFIPETLEKIRSLRETIDNSADKKCLIQVDGGVNSENCKEVVKAGADVLVAGTAVFGESDYKTAVKNLMNE